MLHAFLTFVLKVGKAKTWFKRRILHAPNRIAKLNARKMWRLNQLNPTYFNSMRVSRIFDWSSRIFDWSLVADFNAAFYMCRIELKLCKLCLLEWEFKTRRSRSAILFRKNMWRLNPISRTYSFESTKISIWFGTCKMRRLNQALHHHHHWSPLVTLLPSVILLNRSWN